MDEAPAAAPECRVLVFTMPASPQAHSFRRGNEGAKHFVRISRETREARNGILRDLLVRKGVAEAWDRRACANATVADIDLLALRDTLQRMDLYREEVGGRALPLRHAGAQRTFVPPLFVREPITGTLRPRNFTMLLFGRNVQLFIPGAISFFSTYEGTNRAVARGRRLEQAGTVLSQLDTLLPRLEAEAVTLYDKEDLKNPSVLKYPQRALREALVNAFAHRDYQLHDPLRVTAFVDRVEISSPGGLPLGVRLADLRSGEAGPQWRNQTLAWFFNRLELAEAEGRGADHPPDHAAAGCPPPRFDANEVRVLCTLGACIRER